MYYVYAISSISRKYIYVGLSGDPEKRIAQHNSGYERTTGPYRPYKVISVEAFGTRELARTREKYLKSGVGKEFLRDPEQKMSAGLSADR